MRQSLPALLIAAAVGMHLLLSGCATPADRAAMTPTDVVISKHFPHTLSVTTSGGAETGAMDSSNVADADLKAAIEEAVRNNKLFSAILQGADGDYVLSVRVTSLSKPLFGGTFTVQMETAWSLTRVADRSVVLRKAVQSSGTATMGDAFAAVTRLRLAVEAAARDNIRQGLQAIAGLSL